MPDFFDRRNVSTSVKKTIPAATLIHELRELLIITAKATISTRRIDKNLFPPLIENTGTSRNGKNAEKRNPYPFGVRSLVTLS